MGFKAVRYTNKHEQEWDDFVNASREGTLFHYRKFLNYHRKGRFQDASILVKDQNSQFAVVPAAVVKLEGESVLYSHPGASYGGPVTLNPVTLSEAEHIVQLLIKHAESVDAQQIILTIPPVYYCSTLSNNFEFALHTHGFSYHRRELSSVLLLENSLETIFDRFPESLKRALKKAERLDVRIVESSNINPFYAILQNNLELRHNATPTHTPGELKRLLALFPNDIKLYVAHLNDRVIGGIVTFTCNSRVNLTFYIAHDHEFQTFRVVDSLIWHIIQESKKNRFALLDFGTFTLKEKPNRGLCRYKEKFGARGVFRNTFKRRIS